MQKVLITGVRSSLGGQIAEEFSKNYEVIKTNRSPLPDTVILDMTDEDNVKEVLDKYQPDILIHNAAMTNPGYCEQHKEDTTFANVNGTQNLINHFKGSKFVYISTHWVFDGEKGNYTEEDTPKPLNHYGLSKFQAEEIVKNSGIDYLISRVSVLYGYRTEQDSKKFMLWLLKELKEGREVKLFQDHIVNPTLIDDVAKALPQIINKTGIYHIVSPETISNYNIGIKLCDMFGYDKSLVIPGSVNDDSNLKRGKDLSLNTDKLQKEGIVMNKLESGIKILKEKLDKIRM